MFFLILYFFINNNHPKVVSAARFLHVGMLFATAVISTLNNYNSIYGIGFFFLGGYLALQYNLVKRYRRVYTTVYFLVIASIVEFSALTASEDIRGVVLDVLAFLIFFYMVIITLDTFRKKNLFRGKQGIEIRERRAGNKVQDRRRFGEFRDGGSPVQKAG